MKSRIQFYDELKGICIFTVVYGHIAAFCMNNYSPSLLLIFLQSFFLNMFFFISGLFAWKEVTWTKTYTLDFIIKKFKSIFIPTIVCGAIYGWTNGFNLITQLMSSSKGGYWFTYTLFFIFTIYGLTMFSISALGIKNKNLQSILLVIIIGISMIIDHSSMKNGIIQDLFTVGGITFHLPYFILGVICKKHYDVFHKRIIDNEICMAIIFAIVVLCNYVPTPLCLKTVSTIFLIYGIIKRLGITKNNGETPSYSAIISNVFSHIGKNTIEIYFMHWFLLFQLPDWISIYLTSISSNGKGAAFPELLIIGCLTLLICYCCIILSLAIKQIPFVGKLMFGK